MHISAKFALGQFKNYENEAFSQEVQPLASGSLRGHALHLAHSASCKKCRF